MLSTWKKIISTFLLIIFLSPFSFIVNAQESNINLKEESINPGSSTYFLKRLWEKGNSIFIFNEQSKIDYNKLLLKIRLSELNYIVSHKILSELESSTQRVSYQAGILTNEIVKQNNAQIKGETVREFEQFSKYLSTLRNNYNNSDSSFWRLIQYDIDSLKILSDRIR